MSGVGTQAELAEFTHTFDRFLPRFHKALLC